jgi:hypothetical protein
MGYEPIKEETKEQYLKIWTHYAVGHFNQEQLAKLFNCSHDTVANAIQWCAKNRIQFSTYILGEAAKEALESRLRELRSDLVRIKEEKPTNWNGVIGINRLIQENEVLLWQFQSIIQDKNPRSIYNSQFQDVDYATMYKLEKEEEIAREARAEVDTWTDEQKRLFLQSIVKNIKDEQLFNVDDKLTANERIKAEEVCRVCII